MLFKDRLEIWNPGSLPLGWTTEKLKQLHSSVPANPLLAEPLYLAGYIERMGTGTSDIIRKSAEAGLKEPEFIQGDDFRTVLYRPNFPRVPVHVTDHVTDHVASLVLSFSEEMSRPELQKLLGIKHRPHFMKIYINPALVSGYIELTIPEKPKSVKQKYRLTKKGEVLQENLKQK
ncbi:MAG: hypothetical protein IT279_01745 [Ignavibacteriaceae bacterium]|nr:hypothetical protein [Ignavibacteriaceae bacterium]